MRTLPKIKVCGLTREEDVDLTLSLGADYFGFILYPQSPRGVSLDRAVELAAAVPVGQRVAVDVATSLEDLKRYRDAGFDYFQIHFGVDFEQSKLAEYSKIVGKEKLWLAPRLASEDTFPEDILDYADTILIDTFVKDQFGGTGKVGDWARFNTLKERYPKQTGSSRADFRPRTCSKPSRPHLPTTSTSTAVSKLRLASRTK